MKRFFRALGRFLRRPHVASTLGFVLLLAAIWIGGAWAGMTPQERMPWMMGAMMLWVLSLTVGKAIADRSGGFIEKMLRQQADAAVLGAKPDQRAEITALRQRMLAAIDTLKSSKVGKARGKAALYELPWYMVIGHSAAGKSSAIQHSGLHFPFGERIAVQGVGGTRNCDWFFSSEGVLLDTAGRYATLREDRPEWLAFLRLLRKYRARAPVNGVIVALSLPELNDYRSEHFSSYAKQVRQRINEMDDIFGCKVPVYLVFTKMDLLGGFAQFFEDCTEEERQEVWGATLSHDQGRDFNALSAVGTQFDMLARGLAQLGIDKLARQPGQQKRPALFTFPVEFAALRDAIDRFVELLFHDDPFHSKPLLRGLYFTSALQDGEPHVTAGQRIASTFDITGAGVPRQTVPASHGYFLRRLFGDVIFADQTLVARQTRSLGPRLRKAGIACGLLLATLGVSLLAWSFVANEKLVASAEEELTEARRLGRGADIADRLKGLQVLQLRLEQLARYRAEGPPWTMGWGLYRGASVEQSLRDEYFTGVRSLMLQPVKASLERTIASLGRPPEPPVAPIVRPPAATVPPPVREPAPVRPRNVPRPPAGDGLPSIRIGGDEGDAWRIRPVAFRPASGGVVLAQATSELPRIPLSPAYNLPQAPTYTPASPAPGRTSAVPHVAVPSVPAAPAKPAASVPAIAGAAPSVPLEDGYNALKTYLMLADRTRMESALLSDQLPRHWRTWLTQAPTERPREEVNRLAERVVGFYVAQIEAPDIPVIQTRADVVAHGREVLRGAMQRLTPAERVFNEIKAQANTRFAPLTVGRILDSRDLDIVSGSTAVAGAFTREAWEGYVQGAIADASRGAIQGDDWVLATRMVERLADEAGAARSRADLETLYKNEFAREWRTFLQGVAVQPFASPQAAIAALGRLSDAQQSPIRLLFLRAAQETNWDRDSLIAQALETRKNALVERTERLILGKEAPDTAKSPTPPQLGPLARQFAALDAMTAAAPQGRAPIQAYFDVLVKLRARMSQIVAQAEPGVAARILVQATLNESGSELSEGLTVVDNVLLAQAGEDARDIARPLLTRPLIQTYGTLLPLVEAELERSWQADVLVPWKPLSSRYPLADGTSEASLAEIARFLKPGDGTVARYVDKQLSGLVARSGNGWVPRTWANLGVRFQPAFLPAIGRLVEAGQKLPQDTEVAQFELQPVPTPGLSEILLEIDGQVLRYRNGPQPWTPFQWPHPPGGMPGVRLQVVSVNGVSQMVAQYPGRLGFLRMLSATRAEGAGGAIQIALRSDAALGGAGAGVEGGEASRTIRFNFRSVGGFNPLELSALRRLIVPERVTQQ